MRKVLFLVQLPPPVHGASTVNELIKKSGIINRSLSTQFINISPSNQLSSLGKLSLKKIARFFGIYFSSIFTYIRLNPDLVYISLSPVGVAFYKDALIALSLKILGGKLVFHLHGKGVRKSASSSFFKDFVYRVVFKGVDVIHLSQLLYTDIERYVLPSNFHILANGINSFEVKQCERRYDTPLKILFLSNIIREKGPKELLEACVELKNRALEFEIYMAGKFYENELKLEMLDIIAKEKLTNFYLLEGVYGKDKFKLLGSCHLAVLPTYNDCFPLVLLEAMSAGLAIISTDEGAISEIVDDGNSGFLVKKRSISSIANKIEYFLDNRGEEQTMGVCGSNIFSKRFTANIFERKLLTILETV